MYGLGCVGPPRSQRKEYLKDGTTSLKERDKRDKHGDRMKLPHGAGAAGRLLAQHKREGLLRISAQQCDPIAERAPALRLLQVTRRMGVCQGG